MDTLEVVKKFNRIVQMGTNDGLEAIIADGIIFDGPLFKATGKQDFLAGFQRWIETKKTVRIQHQVVDGSGVGTFCEMDIETPTGVVTLKEADWIEVTDGKITLIKVTFDPRELLTATGR